MLNMFKYELNTHRDFQAEDTRLTRLWKVGTKIFQTGGRRSWNSLQKNMR